MRLHPPKPTGIVVLTAMLAASCVLCIGLRAAYAGEPITATLKPNLGVGVGFDKLAETTQTLTIELKAPGPPDYPGDWYIKSSKPRDNTGEYLVVLWQPEEGISQVLKTHTYTITGIVPNNGHAVGFEGKLIKVAKGEGGTPSDFDAAVADVDIDVDSLGRCQGDHWPPYADDSSDGDNEDASEATDSGGLYLPPALHDNQPEDEEPFPEDTDGTKYKILNVEVRPKWGGPPDVEYVGTLTFEIAEAGVALYGEDLDGYYITKDSSEANRTIDIKPDGLSEEYHILTNNDFTEPGGITATFKWYSELAGGPDTAVDYVRLAPILIHFVRERTEYSGEFVVVDPFGLPTFVADNGIGCGSLPSSWLASIGGVSRFDVTLAQDLSFGVVDTIEVNFENSAGSFCGELVESSPDSGIFSDPENTFTLTLDPSVETSDTTHDTLQVNVTSTALGLTEEPFTLVEAPVDASDSLDFSTISIHGEVFLSGLLDPQVEDTILVEFSTNLDSNVVFATLVETDVDSKVFGRAAEDLFATITSPVGLNPAVVDSLEIFVENSILSVDTFTLELKETLVDSAQFSNYADGSGDEKPSTDITPLDPESSDQGVFYVEVQCAPVCEAIDVNVSSSVDQVIVQASHVADNVFRTGKLALVEQDNAETYGDITTLCAVEESDISAEYVAARANTPAKKSAFIGRALSWFTHPKSHLNDVEQTLIKKLGYTVVKDQSINRADVQAVLPKHDIWYSIQHGVTVDGTDFSAFKKIVVWKGWGSDQIGPPIIQAAVGTKKYDLAFLNGCKTADQMAGSAATAFANAFNATAYVGWKKSSLIGTYSTGGKLFWQNLDGMQTVTQAINATKQSSQRNNFDDLHPLRGGTLVVDLIP